MDASASIQINSQKRGPKMARFTVTLPDVLHKQVLKIANKESDSISYTTAKLIEIGLIVMSNKNKNANKSNELEEYCQKLIIQINGIVKEIAIGKFNFDSNKIAQITNDTLTKFNKLKSS
jgi:hypothetical protein